jgi:hypothetical protein
VAAPFWLSDITAFKSSWGGAQNADSKVISYVSFSFSKEGKKAKNNFHNINLFLLIGASIY